MDPNLGYRSVKRREQAPILSGTWDAILAGRFTASPRDGLLMYDASRGAGEFYAHDGLGNLVPVGANTGWRTSWSQIVPGTYSSSPYSGLLFYDRDAGHGDMSNVSSGLVRLRGKIGRQCQILADWPIVRALTQRREPPMNLIVAG
jgi:hypothetical protein